MSKPTAIPESLVGSGAILIDGLPPDRGGSGMQITDARSEGFFGQITGQPNPAANAYSFARIDEIAPFAAILGDAAIVGDGVGVAAFEMSGSLSVPADGSAVVWLEPLRLGVGYGFTFGGGGSAPAYGSAVLPALYTFTSTNTYENTGLTLALPAAGVYLVTGYANTTGQATSLTGGSQPTAINALLSGAAGAVGFATLLSAQVVNNGLACTAPFLFPAYTATGPDALTLYGFRAVEGSAAWGGCVVTQGALNYLKVG